MAIRILSIITFIALERNYTLRGLITKRTGQARCFQKHFRHAYWINFWKSYVKERCLLQNIWAAALLPIIRAELIKN